MVSGWIERNPHLQWRWIQWLHAMLLSFHGTLSLSSNENVFTDSVAYIL